VLVWGPYVWGARQAGRWPRRSRKGRRPTLSLDFHAAIWLRLHGILREGWCALQEGQGNESEFTAKDLVAKAKPAADWHAQCSTAV
jgi:hypothetical protein